MIRTLFILPLLGILLSAWLPVASDAGVQMTYMLNVKFRCDNGNTVPGYSVYVVGGRAEIGNWDVTKAVKLSPTAYPTWTGTVRFTGANPGDSLEWKCIIRNENNPSDVQTWQPGANNQVTMAFMPEPESTGKF